MERQGLSCHIVAKLCHVLRISISATDVDINLDFIVHSHHSTDGHRMCDRAWPQSTAMVIEPIEIVQSADLMGWNPVDQPLHRLLQGLCVLIMIQMLHTPSTQ